MAGVSLRRGSDPGTAAGFVGVVVLDASVLVSVFMRDEENHPLSREAVATLRRAAGAIVIPNLALAEVAGALSRRTLDARIGEGAIRRLRAWPGLHVEPLSAALGLAAASLAAQFRLRGSDAVYVAVAAQRDDMLWTWDREILDRAREVVRVATPGEVMG